MPKFAHVGNIGFYKMRTKAWWASSTEGNVTKAWPLILPS